MSKRIIAISRQFGSGGRSVAKELAQRLGIAYYDKELVEQVALESGFDPKYIEEQGEYAPGRSILSYAFAYHGTPGVMNGLSAADFLWNIQREVILKIAEKEPCVIVGRCADYVLRDRDDVLSAFIHADLDYRAERIVRLYGETEKSPKKRLQEKDDKRRVYCKHYTDRDWGASENYDLTLNTAKLGQEACVDILEKLYKGE